MLKPRISFYELINIFKVELLSSGLRSTLVDSLRSYILNFFQSNNLIGIDSTILLKISCQYINVITGLHLYIPCAKQLKQFFFGVRERKEIDRVGDEDREKEGRERVAAEDVRAAKGREREWWREERERGDASKSCGMTYMSLYGKACAL